MAQAGQLIGLLQSGADGLVCKFLLIGHGGGTFAGSPLSIGKFLLRGGQGLRRGDLLRRRGSARRSSDRLADRIGPAGCRARRIAPRVARLLVGLIWPLAFLGFGLFILARLRRCLAIGLCQFVQQITLLGDFVAGCLLFGSELHERFGNLLIAFDLSCASGNAGGCPL